MTGAAGSEGAARDGDGAPVNEDRLPSVAVGGGHEDQASVQQSRLNLHFSVAICATVEH